MIASSFFMAGPKQDRSVIANQCLGKMLHAQEQGVKSIWFMHPYITLYALTPDPNSFQTHPNTPCLAFASAGKRCCCLTKTPAVCTSCHSLPKFHFGFLRCLSPVFCIADIPAKQKSIEINGILLMINGGLYKL